MHKFLKVLFVVSLLTVQATFTNHGQELSHPIKSGRKKRSLIFPKGTVIQLVYCYLMSALGTEGIFTVGVTLGTNWDVPGDLEKLVYDEKMNSKLNRRDRRSLYPRIEYVLNQLNVNGKSCVQHLLCRSKQRLDSFVDHRPAYSFIEEIIHIIFSYPSLPVESLEPMDEYDIMIHQCFVNNRPESSCRMSNQQPY